MSIKKYQITSDSDQKVFDFFSGGPNGNFHKRVVFAKTSYEGVFSLTFADFDQNSGYLDYYSISDNGDKDKILATFVSCLYTFLTNTLTLMCTQQEVHQFEQAQTGY